MPIESRFVKRFLILGAGILSAIAAFNRIVDPFQLYHYEPKFCLWDTMRQIPLERLQVAGFIRSFPFDEVIIGTSMSQTLSLNAAKRLFRHHPIQLSMRNASIGTQALAIEAAINSGKAKHVIWGFDQHFLGYDDSTKYESTPVEAFENRPKLILTYLFNIWILKYSLVCLKQLLFPKPVSLENFGNYSESAPFSKEAVLAAYKFSMKCHKVQGKRASDYFDFKARIHNFEHDVIKLLSRHPNINFNIFLPPCSLAYYKLMNAKDPEEFKISGKIREYIMKRLMDFPNVRLFDFEADLPIITNLNLYRDLNHFSRKVGEYILDSIVSNRNLVTNTSIQMLCAEYDTLSQLQYP